MDGEGSSIDRHLCEYQCQNWRTLLQTPRSIRFIPWELETLLSILSGTALPCHKQHGYILWSEGLGVECNNTRAISAVVQATPRLKSYGRFNLNPSELSVD